MAEVSRRNFLKQLGIGAGAAAALPLGLLGTHKAESKPMLPEYDLGTTSTSEVDVPTLAEIQEASKKLPKLTDELIEVKRSDSEDVNILLDGREVGVRVYGDDKYVEILNHLNLEECSFDVGCREPIDLMPLDGYRRFAPNPMGPEVSGRFVFVLNHAPYPRPSRLLGKKGNFQVKIQNQIYQMSMIITGIDIESCVDAIDRAVVYAVSTGKVEVIHRH